MIQEAPISSPQVHRLQKYQGYTTKYPELPFINDKFISVAANHFLMKVTHQRAKFVKHDAIAGSTPG